MIASRQKTKSPILSVITVVFNAVQTLDKSIISVLNQKGYNDHIEYIIVDGCSNDGSLEVILNYEKEIACWISEHDSGIYDAMNKAIDIASGEWIYFLGADDVLEPNVISNILEHLNDKYVMIYGNVVLSNGRYITSFFSRRILLQNTIHHQGAFYHKKLFESFRYDTILKILSDYELNLKIYLYKLPVKYLPIIVANCYDGGASSNMNKSLKETNIVRSRLLGDGLYNKFFSLILWLYYAQKKIRNKFNITY